MEAIYSHEVYRSSADLLPGYLQVPSVTYHWTSVEVGDFLEIRNPDDQDDTSFLWMQEILKHPRTGHIKFRGWLLKRVEDLGGLISHDLNEVCLIAPNSALDTTDIHAALESAFYDIDCELVARCNNDEIICRDVIVTNIDCKDFCSRGEEGWSPVGADFMRRQREGSLYLRWIYATEPENRSGREHKPHKNGEIFKIPEAFCEERFTRQRYGHQKQYGTARTGNQPYTSADICCGAGGASKGIHNAGFSIKFAVDSDSDACCAYQLNFPETEVFEDTIEEFLTVAETDSDSYRVDHLHFSPPCQAYSSVNVHADQRDPTTSGGMRDEANQATSFCVERLLSVCQPRVITVEQTSGFITHQQGSRYFPAFIEQFTAMGYSIRWGVPSLDEYGHVQPRKRFIMIATCPGTPLITLPPPLYGENRLLPLTTINQCLNLYDFETLERHRPDEVDTSDASAFGNGDVPLPHLITTKGSTSLHPGGQRKYTWVECGALMGLGKFQFPPHLSDAKIMRLVGNMVPVCFMETLMECVSSEIYAQEVKGALE